MKSMLVKIAPNTADMTPNTRSPDAKWIRIEGINLREFEKVASITARFFLLRDKIPQGWHPVAFERKGRAK